MTQLLSPEDRILAEAILAGRHQAHVAKRLGCQQPAVSKRFRRLIRRLETAAANPAALSELAQQLRAAGRETRRTA